MNDSQYILPAGELPAWFKYPAGLKLLVSHGTVDFVTWRFPEAAWASETYAFLRTRYARELYPVAYRVGSDDCVCLERGSGETMKIINGYTTKGAETEKEFSSFWEWFRYAIDELVELHGDDAA